MNKLIEFIIHGCWHHWKLYHIANTVDKDAKPIGIRVYYQCENCSHIKAQDLR